MLTNYFFIDGSALTAQIRVLRRQDGTFQARRLVPSKLIDFFTGHLVMLQAQEFKRATFYFPKGDEVAIEEYLVPPEFNKPGAVRDIQFKFCGQKLKGSADFTAFVESAVPPKWRDRFNKSEKGVDIEMCCDALKLASASRMERLFLLTNDDDFLPLCRTLKEFGTNISIIHLTDCVAPNTSLVSEADSYDVVPVANLQTMFVPSLAEIASQPVLSTDIAPVDATEVTTSKELKGTISTSTGVDESNEKDGK